MKDRKAVKLKAVDLANEIREFCRSQVDLWRQIPWLAADADGRLGGSRQMTLAYAGGVWLVEAPTAGGGVTHAYVDLLTGELLDTRLFHRDAECTPITDLEVLPFALAIDRLDASHVLHQIKVGVDTRPYGFGVDVEQAQAWLVRIRSAYNLKPIYDGTAKRSFG